MDGQPYIQQYYFDFSEDLSVFAKTIKFLNLPNEYSRNEVKIKRSALTVQRKNIVGIIRQIKTIQI